MVAIYEDPITEKRPEGKARLVRRLNADHEGGMTLERWLVRFEGDAQDFERWVRVAEMADGGPEA